MSDRHRRAARTLVLFALALLLAGCAVQQGEVRRAPETPPPLQTEPQPAPSESAPGPETMAPSPPPDTYFPHTLAESGASTAVLALVQEAGNARASGDKQKSLAYIERALHIAPRNPFVWQSLADAHLALGHADEAEAAARKSNALARGNPWLESSNWRLIGAARAARGDGAGARLANARADSVTDEASPAP